MKRHPLKRVCGILRSTLRGTAALALAAKFVVPVGFMPAAVADGGPFRLCDAGWSAPAEERSHDAQQLHEASADPHGHETRHGHEQGNAEHGHDDPSASHTWERCALGGLASLAAIAGDWHFALPQAGPAPVAAADSAAVYRRAIIAFRSRAPPLRHA